MPNWKTHLEIGKRLNEQLKYNENDYNIFLLGSILPDINNGYIVTNISKRLDHDITHLGHFINETYIKFKDKYKEEIKNRNPLFMGYLAHLYTDCTWNKDFYTKIEKLDIKVENRDELRIMKQSDFMIYNNKFIENIIIMKDVDKALSEIGKIEEVFVDKEDVLKVIEFLKKQKPYEAAMQFYTTDQLNNLLEDTVKGYKENYILKI